MDQIDRLRRFNRFYTSELGFLERRYLGSEFSLPEIRVLYEIAHEDGPTASAIARSLMMDEGYLSRVIKDFERRGLVARDRDPADRRRTILALTSSGQSRMAELELASRDAMGALLDRVPKASLACLTQSMSALQHILGGVSTGIELRGLQHGDIGWAIKAQGEAYARDEGYNLEFEILVARLLSELADRVGNGAAAAWIAQAEDDRLGCIFRDHEADDTARLRMFFVEPRARGLGLGRRLMDECLNEARNSGYRRMVLWTHESHRAACALYAEYGFVITASSTEVEFGVPSVSQNWELTL